MEETLKLKEEDIYKLDLDGEWLYLLDEKDINEIGEIPKKEKEILIKALKEVNIEISEESDVKEVNNFLKKTLGFGDIILNNIELS